MEGEVTLEALAAWHDKRAQDCLATMARATHIPKAEGYARKAAAQFHIAAMHDGSARHAHHAEGA